MRKIKNTYMRHKVQFVHKIELRKDVHIKDSGNTECTVSGKFICANERAINSNI